MEEDEGIGVHLEVPDMLVTIEKCMHCGACVGTCPENAIYLNDVLLEFNSDCTRCGRCVRMCPVGALKLEAKA
ncbi:MAG: 4Fe-4S binding protein [Methanomassiliicoccales archaeon]|nr:4Fe-4S binding protein [Methanomassiliicoccales archaeon]